MPTHPDTGDVLLSQSSQEGTRFFVSGGSLQPDAPSYVERKADDVLLQTLLRGEFCYILDTRQVGKSSLMVRAKGRLEQSGVRAAVLDLTTLGRHVSIEQWYEGLLCLLGEQMGLEDTAEEFWSQNQHRGPLQRFVLAIRKVILPGDTPLVIFIDEIDSVRSLPFSTDEFFAAIRAFYNQRATDPALLQLTFCMLGVASPAELVQDVRTTPFNIGRRIELTDFDATEAAPLAAGLSWNGGTGGRRLRRILHWTGGHPYLTQRLCEAVSAVPTGMLPDVDHLCRSLFFTQEAPEQDDNLAFVRRRLLESDTDLAGLLDLYGRVRYSRRRVPSDEADPRTNILRLSGIVLTEAGCLRVRNRIYARVFDRAWIKSVMPGAELRRQRVALRKGVVRTLAATVLVLSVVWFGGGVWLDRDPKVMIPVQTDPVPNAYYDFEKASSSLTDASAVELHFGDSPPHLTPQQMADIVQRNTLTLHWLRLGLTHHFRYQDVSKLGARYRTLTRLLVLAGQVKSSQGDWGGGAQCDIDAIAFGSRITENGPDLNRLIGLAFEGIGQRALEETIGHLDATQATFITVRLTNLIQARFPIEQTMEEEKWDTQTRLLVLFHKPHWRDTFYQEQFANVDISDMSSEDVQRLRWEQLRLRTRLLTVSKCTTIEDVTDYLDSWRRLTQQYQYGAILPRGHAGYPFPTLKVPDTPDGVLSQDFTIPEKTMWKIDTRSITITNLLLIASALRAYRLKSGHYPVRLDELRPSYLIAMPNDPFSSYLNHDTMSGLSNAYRYIRIGDKYLLYSVGPDGRDDHGQPIARGTDGPGDIVLGHLFAPIEAHQ